MKCLVDGCDNRDDQGKFIGRLCAPCFEYLTEGKGEYSQACRNEKERIRMKLAMEHIYSSIKEFAEE